MNVQESTVYTLFGMKIREVVADKRFKTLMRKMLKERDEDPDQWERLKEDG